MASVNDLPASCPPPVGCNFNTTASAGITAAVGNLAGAPVVVMQNTAATPGTITPRTAAQMVADHGLQVNQTWLLALQNDQGTGAWTLGTASGVTVSGTATAGTNACTLFLGQVTAANTIVFTRICTFTTAA